MHHMSGPMGCLERIDNLTSERNALHAEVERLTNQVESERALRAIVEEERDELRARLDEAERLLRRCYRGGSGEVDAAIVAFCQPHVISPPDAPYSAHVIQVENARAHARESDLAETDMRKQLQTASRLIGKLEAKVKDIDDRFNHNAAKYNAHLLEFDALGAKVAKVEYVVKRIDTEHDEMCTEHLGLSAPPAPVRARCETWCGHSYQEAGVPVLRMAREGEEPASGLAWLAGVSPAEVWCKPSCRNLRLGPNPRFAPSAPVVDPVSHAYVLSCTEYKGAFVCAHVDARNLVCAKHESHPIHAKKETP